MGKRQSSLINRFSKKLSPAGAPSGARVWVGRLTIFALGLAAGLGLADSSSVMTNSGQNVGAPAAEETNSSRMSSAPPNAQSVTQTAPEDESGLIDAWLKMAEGERLRSLAGKVTGAGLDLVARSVIDRLEEESLVSLIASTTDFSSAELSQIEDVPAFALGLARVAMEGTVRDAEEPDEEVRPVDFATEVTWDHRAAEVQSQFYVETERIYAVFESDALGSSRTLAKWTRVDDGEILLFKRHDIRSAANSSFVWLDAPPAGWAPGEYRVDFYSADPELRWLASGTHRISR